MDIQDIAARRRATLDAYAHALDAEEYKELWDIGAAMGIEIALGRRATTIVDDIEDTIDDPRIRTEIYYGALLELDARRACGRIDDAAARTVAARSAIDAWDRVAESLAKRVEGASSEGNRTCRSSLSREDLRE